jgi:hypothetical protein
MTIKERWAGLDVYEVLWRSLNSYLAVCAQLKHSLHVPGWIEENEEPQQSYLWA